MTVTGVVTSKPWHRYAGDARMLWELLGAGRRGRTDRERLTRFYLNQASGYDDFRSRLLHGREVLIAALDPPDQDGVWVDIGGGTGSNLHLFGPRLARFRQIFVVDLARPLLEQARARVESQGWTNVRMLEADARAIPLAPGSADIVTLSYSLTMIPDWFAALDASIKLLKPGGRLGLVDFYVSRKHPGQGLVRHSWWSRSFWPLWFAYDNVFLNADHLPYLSHRLTPLHVFEGRGTVPYLPGARVPYYVFVGRNPTNSLG